jgi:hypothetical protein
MTTNNSSFTSRGRGDLPAFSISSHMVILLNSEGRLHCPQLCEAPCLSASIMIGIVQPPAVSARRAESGFVRFCDELYVC